MVDSLRTQSVMFVATQSVMFVAICTDLLMVAGPSKNMKFDKAYGQWPYRSQCYVSQPWRCPNEAQAAVSMDGIFGDVVFVCQMQFVHVHVSFSDSHSMMVPH